MSKFKVVLASGAEHLKTSFSDLGIQVYCSARNFDGKRFFPNSDLYVRIADIEELAGQRAVVVQSCTGSTIANEYFTTSDRIQELILILDVLAHPCRVEKVGHKEYQTEPLEPPSSIEVVLTFQPFALQDKAFQTGEAVSSRSAMESIANFCDKLWIVDPVVNRGLSWTEKLVTQGKYEVIDLTQEIISHAAKFFQFDDYILTAPDEGSQKRFGVPGFSKRRTDSFTIEMNGTLDVKGKNVILLDDIVKSGNTLLRAAEMLRSQGAADVGIVVQHVMPIRDGGEMRLEDLISKSNGKIITSNTVYSHAFCDNHPNLVYDIVEKITEVLHGYG